MSDDDPRELFASPPSLTVAMSYYMNGPRTYTPSTLKSTKTSSPIESFGASTTRAQLNAGGVPVNTSFRTRGRNMQYTYPNTFAILRKVEEDKVQGELEQRQTIAQMLTERGR